MLLWKNEHQCQSAISIKLFCNVIEITLRHKCSPVNLPHSFRRSFYKNTSGRLPLTMLMENLHQNSCYHWLILLKPQIMCERVFNFKLDKIILLTCFLKTETYCSLQQVLGEADIYSSSTEKKNSSKLKTSSVTFLVKSNLCSKFQLHKMTRF